jgi:uncharacterized protein
VGRVAYVDASALVKLIVDEPGSPAMHRWFVETERLLTSRVGAIETRRAAVRVAHQAGRVNAVLEPVGLIELDEAIAARAAIAGPVGLKTLDAIHLSTALEIGPIDAFVTYDDRLAEAARLVGLPVVRPA